MSKAPWTGLPGPITIRFAMAEPASAHADLTRLRIARDDDDAKSGSSAFKWVGIGLGVAALAAVAWFAWDRLKPAPVVKVWRVPTAAASSAKSLDASGYLVPQRRAEVATKTAGVVAKVLAEEGDEVTVGQTLAELVNDAEKALLEEAQVAVTEAKAMQASSWKGVGEAEAGVESAKRGVASAQAVRPGLEKALDEAEARREEARRDWERMKILFESKDVGEGEKDAAEAKWKAAEARWSQAGANIKAADADIEKAKADVATAEAGVARSKAAAEASDARTSAAETRVKQAKIRLDDTVIRSPIAGRVVSKKIHAGEAASPAGIVTSTGGGALFTVADFSSLEAEVDVNEARLSELREKHPARIAVDAVPSKRYRGELKQIVPTADRARAVVKVRVRLLDPDKLLLPEMGLRVTFVEDDSAPVEAPRPAIPREAVLRSGGTTSVWIVAEGKAVRRVVELGAEKDGKVEVKSGLSGGEAIVMENAVPLSEGLKVTAEEK